MVDANVLISGTGWPRFPYEVLAHAVAGDYQLVLSPYIIDEARTHIAHRLPAYVEKFEVFLVESEYEAITDPTNEDVAAHAGLVRDAKDIPVALSAINARVECLVSLDKDLTDPNEPIHQHLTVLLPGTFLRQYMGWTSEALESIHTRTWKDVLSR